MKKTFFFLFSFNLLISPLCWADPVFDMPPQVEVYNYEPPILMQADGKNYLVYELHLTNFDKTKHKLTSLEVLDADSPDKAIAVFDENALSSMILEVGSKEGSVELQPGMRNVVFVWMAFDEKEKLPTSLTHQLTFAPDKEGAAAKTITMPVIHVEKINYAVLSKPFNGNNWYAANGPSNMSGHRRAVLVMNGAPYIGQRYAIDWVKIGANHQTYEGDVSKNENYFAYNEDVLAVGDGKVVKVVDGIPENTPGDNSRAVVMTPHTLGGNQVALDLGGGMYALYAHLIPGSIKVKEGDFVKRGQVLAKLGNSGNSTEAHLHLQISDQPDFIAAEGVPYVFAAAKVHKTESSESEIGLGKIKTKKLDPMNMQGQLVLDKDLVDFG